jgi:sporulation protein YlmC with PRC-barrel domain
MEQLKKSIIIEYLINEIDNCEPKEEVYKSYCSDLYKISNLDIKLDYSSYKQLFIMKITSMSKKDIITFCKNELFIIPVTNVEKILGRKLNHENYDNYTPIDTNTNINNELYDSDESIDYSFYF